MDAPLYNADFYHAQSGGSFASARIVLAALREIYDFRSVLDAGCGVGTWLHAAEELGAEDSIGLDGDYLPRDALLISPERFIPTDIAQPFDLQRRFDLVMCLEAAEHLPPEAADTLVRSLTAHGDVILFSAALPFQGGMGHVNENWLEYWCALFEQRGFHAIDTLRWQIWRDARIDWWYRQGVLLFQRNGVDKIARRPPRDSHPASVAHPELLLRAVRRRPTHAPATNLDQDIAYWRAVCAETPAPAPGYGKEFQPAHNPLHFSTYADLHAAPRWRLPAALADAIAPILPTHTPPSALTRSAFAPDFIALGAPGPASAWIYETLRRHPDALLPPIPGVHFFNRRAFEPWSAYSGIGLAARVIAHMRDLFAEVDEIWPPWVQLLAHIANPADDQAWYERIFQLPVPQHIKGEITPDYAMLPPHGFSDMLTLNPNLKIVIVLRDPVEQARSQLRAIIQQAPEAANFVDDLSRQDSVRRRGRYERILPLLEQTFAPEQRLVLHAEKIAANPRAQAHKLASFLGLDPTLLPPDVIPRASPRHPLALSPQAHAELEDDYAETRHYLAEMKRALNPARAH